MDKIKEWAVDVLVRTVKTAAQTALGVIGASYVLTDVDWLVCASAVGLSCVVCVLMNIANYPWDEKEA